jgi:hypothetical protein
LRVQIINVWIAEEVDPSIGGRGITTPIVAIDGAEVQI